MAGLLAGVLLVLPAVVQRLPVDRITLPPGFRISVFADNVPNARSLAHGSGRGVFVSTRSAGRVYALRYSGDAGAEPRGPQLITLASGLNMPDGIALRDGALYVAEVNRTLHFDEIKKPLDAVTAGHGPKPVVVTECTA